MSSKNILRRFVVIYLSLIPVFSSLAEDVPDYSLGGEMLIGGNPAFAKAGGDTINLMSTRDDPTNGPGEPLYFGDFENAFGGPDWNGWTHVDLSRDPNNQWQVSNYNQADPLNHAAWCGSIDIPSCGIDDPAGGYGNGWDYLLEFRHPVADPGSNSLVTVTADLMLHTEPEYDFVHLSYQYEGQPIGDIQSWDGEATVAVNNSVTYLPAEYLDGTDIAIYFRFVSDGAYSDEDCEVQGAGGCQVDNINVNIVNGVHTTDHLEDFEHGGDPEFFGLWQKVIPQGVGDFAQLWKGLDDIDPCVTNFGYQVAFIDDGLVVPGTGGSECINWCYGPNGYIVTTTGGLLGPDYYIYNQIESPVMDWPVSPGGGGADFNGIIASFGIYRHEDLSTDSPGIFYNWGIRSADTDDSAGNGIQTIEDQPWKNRSFVYYGGPGYVRMDQNVTDLMNPGRDQVQVALNVREVGWLWGWVGNDGYPAPYFDNVTVKVFPQIGPAMSAREIDLAQDNFPERGSIDYGDLGSHSVRFDMARNISRPEHMRNDPGDSIVVRVAPMRSGAQLVGPPELHYSMRSNPMFDSFRTSGLPAVGMVAGDAAFGVEWDFISWEFDLPDTGFLFPGDILHYYISATDAIGGPGGSDPQTAFLPADTTGFSTNFWPVGFTDPSYNSSFTVRALPTIDDDGFSGYAHVPLLFINDFANRGDETKWHRALHTNSFRPGHDYDTYYVNGPSSGIGNGIGGRANQYLLEGYQDILYTSGDLAVNTISNGDFNIGGGDDLGTLRDWLDQGSKDIFLTGDNLASDLAQSGSATLDFATDYMGVQVSSFQVRQLIDNQVAPLVRIIPGNLVFTSPSTWVAYGGCPGLNSFDGTVPTGSAQRLAEFTNPAGLSGYYPYSAATLNVLEPGPDQIRVISMPVDFQNIRTDHEAPPGYVSARTRLLGDVMSFMGVTGGGGLPTAVDVPAPSFSVTNHPNPFNPATTITYTMPRAGHLKLSVYNIRGQLVKTLIDGVRPAGENQTTVWDGTNSQGSSAASGIYFYEARNGEDVIVGKMTLLK